MHSNSVLSRLQRYSSSILCMLSCSCQQPKNTTLKLGKETQSPTTENDDSILKLDTTTELFSEEVTEF